jgi:hypothetical protein
MPAARGVLDDDELLAALLCHPIISQDQQAVAELQQTSKQLQAAVARLLPPGMPPVTLHVTCQPRCSHLGCGCASMAACRGSWRCKLPAARPAAPPSPLTGYGTRQHQPAHTGLSACRIPLLQS